MIPQIKEVNFGPNTANDYATLHQATVNLSTMGDRTITTQVRIDGDVVPDFTGWELEFRGERFILPTREPQARKDNTTKNSLIDLTFYSWPVYELKRYFFVEMSSTTSGTAIADKYDASLALNLENFVDAFNLVLDHYFNGRIQISLFGQGQGIYSTDPVFFEINYTKLWEVLQKVYEMYNVRWWFDYDSASGIYLIKMGYTADSIDDHDFSYGYKGGLLSFERTVQSDDLVNILLGRGGEKNLPYRYFKRTDPENPGWTADPDAIPELANIYFDRLHDVNFRWYVRGWMTNPTPNRDRSWEQEGYVYPTYSISPDSPYYFAYQKGATDAKFNPVEYVKDDESIAAHGEVWGALDDNDDIYPTIQGVDIPNDSPDIGRVDESVAISQIETDDISAYASAAAVETTIKDMKVSLPGNNVLTHTIYSEPFTIAQGETGNVTYRPFSKETVYPNFVYYDTTRSTLVAEPLSGGSDQPGTPSYDETTGLYAVSGLPAGTYRLKLNLVLRVDRPAQLATGTFGIENVVLTTSAANTNAWKPTFDIWVKNLWQTTQGTNESNKDYAERVWGPILGDRLGDEAKIVFSTGAMSISQDYEFVIADYPVPDKTKTINGVPSEWKITVYKSDAEYQATGLYIPNASSAQPLAGDKFFFVGIDMPFQYVEWAEERLNQYKTDNLEGMSEISPTWTLKLDKVRINSLEDEDYGQKLADRLDAGVMIRTTDPRFTHGDILNLYIQSITWTWNEPSKGNPYIVPDVEVILADKVSAVESPISRLENDVNVISQTYVQSGDVEAVVRRVASALFLKKTGESDSSSSPTTFSSKVTSKGFRKGGIGGAGWGLYEDNSRKFSQSSPATRADVSEDEETIEPRTVLEVDRLVVREEMEVNNLVINQISARGGREIISAARIETTLVRETDSAYVCYFDQKQNSVANLFQVNDVAYGQVWSADNMELRFYKMLVTAVDVNSITLAKAGRYGSGAPQEGDVIVQYGNTTNARRQYVIIRDVVGGGHDRMLSGLNSVSAEGVEYYYAGVETGDTPRWFVGDREAEYAEYKDGVLNIKGQLSVLKSDGSYQAMSDYIDQINANETNLQNQIDNNIQSWSASASPLPISDGGTVDPTTANYPASQWEDDETRLKHVGDIYTDETSGQSYRYTRLPNDGDFYWMRISDEEAAQALQQANQALQGLAGLNYLKAATNNGTTLVDGGLILSNLIALGKTEEDVFNIYSGINGIMDPNAYGNGIAAWYGGPMTDHEAEPTEALYANSLFRFDGSGYLAGGLLKWGLDNGAAFLTLNGQAVVGGLGGTTLNDIANLLFDVVQYKTGHYAVKLRPNAYYGGNLVTIDGLYAEGWVSAGGVSDQGGGGGGTGYLRDLLDVNASMSPTQGQALVWDDALGKWTAGDVSVDLTPFERIANRVTTVSSSSNHTQYPTAKAVYDIVNTMLSSAMRFQGVTSTALVDGSTTNPVVVDGASYTATRGDVVVRSDVGLEYLWTGAKWQQLGDETSYAKKTVTITGSGYLTGGGNLEAARTIDVAEEIKAKIDNGATAFSYFTGGAANEAIKLKTARKLWGQSFDGSGNVDGDLTFGSGYAIDNLRTIRCAGADLNHALYFGYNAKDYVSWHEFGNDWRFYYGQATGEGSSALSVKLGAVNYFESNVGIGAPSPAYKLDISGDSRTSGKVYIGTSGGFLEVVNVGTTASPVYALKSSLPFYSDSWVSAGGVSPTGSGGGITGYLKDLLDVNGSMIPVDGQALVWDSSLGDNGRWTSKNVSVDLTPFERTTNKVTSISASSTDGQYPSARAVYSAMGNYLPLTGGTMTGWINHTWETGDKYKIERKTSGGGGWSYSPIAFTGGDDATFFSIGAYGRFANVSYAYLGMNAYDGDNLRIKSDGVSWGENTIWHAGNDGAGSGLDADLLDGLQPSQLDVNTAKTLKGYDDRDVNNPPSWYMSNPGQVSIFTEFAQAGGAVSLPNYESRTTFTPWADASGGRPTQLSLSDSGAFFRTSASDSAWNSWREFAFTDSNVASATKLEVARSISISDSISSHTGTEVAFDGTAPIVLPLPSTINATIIGTATSITESSIEDEEFTYQATPINDIADGYRIDRVKGKTLVWNQLAKDLETQLFWAAQYGSISNGQYDSGSVPSGAYGLLTADWTTLGHIYILSFYITNNATVQAWVGDTYSVIMPNSSRVRKSIRLVPSAGNSRPLIGFNCDVNGATYQIGNICLFDLTQMFGAGNEPETVEEFEAMFPETYYDYNPGELINNSAEGIETVGFNQWDEEWEPGAIYANGSQGSASGWIRSKNFCPCIPGADYYYINAARLLFYDSSKKFVQLAGSGIVTAPANAAYFKISTNTVSYNHNICVNISDPDRNGEYEPYWSAKTALGLSSIKVKDSEGNILEFNGLASAGRIYDDTTGAKLTQRVGRINLGSLNWAYYGDSFVALNTFGATHTNTNIVCPLYRPSAYSSTMTDKSVHIDSNGQIYIKDSSYTDAASFKAAMSGVYLYYELATPVTYELVSPVPLSGRIDGNGTMRVISDGPVAPFRGDITYGCNPGQMGADASSVKSYLDTMLEIKVVNGVPMLHTTLPFYSDSFVSAGGLSGTGGSGSGSSLRDLSDVQLPEIITTGSALVYNGEKWVQSGAAFVPQTRTVNGLELSSNISLSLGDLSNVNTAGASNGQSLIYNGGEWIAGTPAGAKFFHGTCSTSSSSNTKVVDCPSFTSSDLVAGTAIAIVMYNRSDTTSTVTINVNGTGANTLLAGFANRKAWSAGELILAVYDGSGTWDMLPTWYYTYYYGGGGSGGGGGTGSTVVVAPSYTSGPTLATITVDGTGYAIKMPVFVSQTQLSANGTAIGSILVGTTSTTLYAPTVTVTQVQTSGVEVARIKVGSTNPVSIFAPSGSGGASGVQTVVGKTGDVTTAQIADALTNAGYKLTDTVVDTSSFLPLSAGSGKALTGDLYTRAILPTASNTYDLGSSSKYFKNNYMKRIYLADGVYIEYDSTNRCVYVHGAGIATDSFVSAGGVSNT